MALFSRGIRCFAPQLEFTCSRCVKFSTTSTAQSGHSRWSKIKHEKGIVDSRRSKERSFLSREIATASKVGGPDPNLNLQLANALASAKKAGFPKASMEAAIQRGQGKSVSGASLENVMLETIIPPQVAMIIEAETDNSKRTLTELRYLIKEAGGTVTPTSYLFEKKGRVAFAKDANLGVDDVLDEAIEAGAEDVEEDEDGAIVVWTEPNMTTATAEALQKKFGLKVESSDIIWDPKEDTKLHLDAIEHEDAIKNLKMIMDQIRDSANFQGLYANLAQGNLRDAQWEEIQDKLDA